MGELYAFQKRAVDDVTAELRAGRSVCLIAPTGAGKTVMGAAVAAQFKNPLCVTPSRELVRQNGERLCRTVTVQSLLKRPLPAYWPEPDLVVWDEAHHSASDAWAEVMRRRFPLATTLGLTATPERADGKPLAFDVWYNAISYSQLVAQGRIVPCAVYATERKSKTVADPAREYLRHVRGLQTIIFAQNTERADACAAKIGPRAAAYHSKAKGLAKIMKRWLRREIDVLVTCDMLTEGFDCPDVQCVVLARTCEHAGTYIQACGRAARAAEGKRLFHLIDCSGASERHGNPIQDWQFKPTKGIVRGNAVGSAPPVAAPRPLDDSLHTVAPERGTEEYERLKRDAWEFLVAEAARIGEPAAASKLYVSRFGEAPGGI